MITAIFPWWICPLGKCEHGNTLHDIESSEDERPRCTVPNCDCGS